MTTILLDSGAFSATYSGAAITLEDYMGFLDKYAYLFQGGQISLDVIGDRGGSYKNWEIMRSHGYNVIPVFHAKGDDDSDDGGEILKKYLDKTDYIAIGAIARFGTAARIYCLDRIWRKYLLDGSGNPTHKVHGLGMTSIRLITRYPWYSLDSASCTKGAMAGRIMFPRSIVTTDTPDYTKIHMFVVSDQQHSGLYTGSLYSQPQLIQDRIRAYCNRLGFDFSASIQGRKLMPRRGRKDEVRTAKYRLLDTPVNDQPSTEKNLTNNWAQRQAFNYRVFDELAKQIDCKIYHACTNSMQPRTVHALKLKCGALVSYAYCRHRSILRSVLEVMGVDECKSIDPNSSKRSRSSSPDLPPAN